MKLNTLQTSIINSLNWLHYPFRKMMPPVTFRYAACGGGNMVFDVLLYFITYNYILEKQMVDLGFYAISAHIAAFLFVFPITFFTGFLLAKYITFTQSNLQGNIQLLRYGLTVSGSILLNYMFLKILVELFGMYATLAKIVTTFLVVIYSYYMQKYFTFKTTIPAE